MNLTLKNQDVGTRSYLGGIVTVSEASQTTIPRELNVPIVSDAQFISDVSNKIIILNNGATDMNEGAGLELIKVLGNFSTDPLATLFIYYSAPVNIRQTATSTIGTTVWTLRNPALSPFNYVIEGMLLKTLFDGATPLAPSSLVYDICRFNTATPTGGSAIPAIKASNLAPSIAPDIRMLDTGLSTTSVVFETPFDSLSCPAVKGAFGPYDRTGMAFKLGAGEGLAIRISTKDAIVGQGICGRIVWSLR